MKTAPKRFTRGLALGLTTIWAASTAAQTTLPDLSWVERELLDAGEIAVRSDKEGGGIVSVDIAIKIHAPAQAIWSILTACELSPEYVPNVVDCERVETLDGGTAELFVQTVKPAFFLPRFEHVFRLDYHPFERIDVSRVSGPIEHMQGSWWLLPEADGTILLAHSLELNPGMPVPRVFVRAALRRNTEKIMAAVRARAEALQ